MKKLNIKRIENAVCEYGFHRGKHCVLLTTCVTEDSPQMSLQQIHKYVDECKPKLILLQGETDNPQDDPCNPQSFTPVIMSAFLQSTKYPIHITTMGSWETNLMVDWVTIRFCKESYPLHSNVTYGGEAIINVETLDDIEAWLYCADEKLTCIHSWIKQKNGFETDDLIKDYIMTETHLDLKWHAPTPQI